MSRAGRRDSRRSTDGGERCQIPDSQHSIGAWRLVLGSLGDTAVGAVNRKRCPLTRAPKRQCVRFAQEDGEFLRTIACERSRRLMHDIR